MNQLSPMLIRAYREALYEFTDKDINLVLKVGIISEELSEFMTLNNYSSAAVITAFNPYSEQLSNDDNEKLQSALKSDLEALNLTIFNGYGRDSQNQWPAEPSFLVFSPKINDIENLALKYKQHAFLFVYNNSGFISLNCLSSMRLLTEQEQYDWINSLPDYVVDNANLLNLYDKSVISSLPIEEQIHWLISDNDRNIQTSWPHTNPQGMFMAKGTEMDRLFRIQAGNPINFFNIQY